MYELIVIFIVNLLDIIACTVVIYLYKTCNYLKTIGYQIILTIEILNLFYAILSIILSIYGMINSSDLVNLSQTACKIEGFLTTFTKISLILWNGALSLTLFLEIYANKNLNPNTYLNKLFVCILPASIILAMMYFFKFFYIQNILIFM